MTFRVRRITVDEPSHKYKPKRVSGLKKAIIELLLVAVAAFGAYKGFKPVFTPPPVNYSQYKKEMTLKEKGISPGLYSQLGVFSNPANAKRIANKNKKGNNWRFVKDEKGRTHVVEGPFLPQDRKTLEDKVKEGLRRNEELGIVKYNPYKNPYSFSWERLYENKIKIDFFLQKYCDKYDMDFNLAKAIMATESAYNPKAVSKKGARGLMQVMPKTARYIGIKGDLHDMETNIHAGVKYLSYLRDNMHLNLKREQHLNMLLAAYNAGPNAVRRNRRRYRSRWLNHMPNETRIYVHLVKEKKRKM